MSEIGEFPELIAGVKLTTSLIDGQTGRLNPEALIDTMDLFTSTRYHFLNMFLSLYENVHYFITCILCFLYSANLCVIFTKPNCCLRKERNIWM